jgi:hypothetical protein
MPDIMVVVQLLPEVSMVDGATAEGNRKKELIL